MMLPTRKRMPYVKKSIDSLIKTASDINNFEVNFIFDNDDVDSISEFEKWEKNFNFTFQVTQRVGYHSLHLYYNQMASVSHGKWLFVWNDDSEMVSKDWDKVILGYGDKVCIINPQNLSCMEYTVRHNKCMHPVFPRFFYDVTGVVSRNQHTDNYFDGIGVTFGGIMISEPGVQHLHPEERIQDEVTREIRYHSNHDVCSQEVFDADMNKIREYMAKNNLSFYKK